MSLVVGVLIGFVAVLFVVEVPPEKRRDSYSAQVNYGTLMKRNSPVLKKGVVR